jgi:hypothetical protein
LKKIFLDFLEIEKPAKKIEFCLKYLNSNSEHDLIFLKVLSIVYVYVFICTCVCEGWGCVLKIWRVDKRIMVSNTKVFKILQKQTLMKLKIIRFSCDLLKFVLPNWFANVVI